MPPEFIKSRQVGERRVVWQDGCLEPSSAHFKAHQFQGVGRSHEKSWPINQVKNYFVRLVFGCSAKIDQRKSNIKKLKKISNYGIFF